jgi:hypothetical protein
VDGGHQRERRQRGGAAEERRVVPPHGYSLQAGKEGSVCTLRKQPTPD